MLHDYATCLSEEILMEVSVIDELYRYNNVL